MKHDWSVSLSSRARWQLKQQELLQWDKETSGQNWAQFQKQHEHMGIYSPGVRGSVDGKMQRGSLRSTGAGRAVFLLNHLDRIYAGGRPGV